MVSAPGWTGFGLRPRGNRICRSWRVRKTAPLICESPTTPRSGPGRCSPAGARSPGEDVLRIEPGIDRHELRHALDRQACAHQDNESKADLRGHEHAPEEVAARRFRLAAAFLERVPDVSARSGHGGRDSKEDGGHAADREGEQQDATVHGDLIERPEGEQGKIERQHAGSAPKRRVQSPWLRMTWRSRPATSSSARNSSGHSPPPGAEVERDEDGRAQDRSHLTRHTDEAMLNEGAAQPAILHDGRQLAGAQKGEESGTATGSPTWWASSRRGLLFGEQVACSATRRSGCQSWVGGGNRTLTGGKAHGILSR